MTGGFEDYCWRDVVSDDVLKIYRAYERPLRVGARPALLAIDLYRLAFAGGPRPVLELQQTHPSSCGEHAWAALPHLERLMTAARKAGLPIIYSTQETRPEAKAYRTEATKRRLEKIDPHAFEIQPELAPHSNDLIVFKQRASVFFGTPLVAQMLRLGVDSLIVCGESTSGCVRASVVDAYSHGFHVTVIEEGCFDRSLLSHKINLFDMHHKYADVMHLENALAALEGRGTVAEVA
jgi:maleamate amidohydrolase